MATNFIKECNITNFVAPAGGVTAGTPVVIQQTLCLPIVSATVGVTFAAYVCGVWEVAKAAGTTATAGARAYWDQVAGQMEATDAADNFLVGYFAEAAVNGQTTCRVNVLNGVAGDANLDLSNKANKVVPGAAGNLAGLTAGGDLQDSTIAAATLGNMVTEGANAAGANFVMISTGVNRIVDDSTILIGDVVTMAANGGAGNLLQTAAANKAASDAGIAVADVVTMAAAAAGAGLVLQSAGASKVALATAIAAADIATMAANGTAGNLIQSAAANKTQSDSGILAANVVTQVANAAAGGTLPVYAGANKILQDSTMPVAFVPTMAAMAGGAGRIIQSAAGDRTQSDSGVLIANLATMAANGTAGNLIQSAGADKTQSDSGVAVANVPTMAAAAGSAGLILTSGGANKTVVATTLSQFPAVEAVEHNASAALSMVAEGCVGCIQFSKEVADAADLQLTLPAGYNIRVIRVWGIKTAGAGAAGDTVQLMNGGAAISDAISLNVADQTVVNATTIDDAQYRVAGGGLLTADYTLGGGGNTQSKLFVEYLRVA